MSVVAPRILRHTADFTASYGALHLVDASAGPVVATLPNPSVGLAGIQVKKTDSSLNPVTLTRAGAALIDGATTVVLNAQYMAVTVDPDGTSWQRTNRVITAPGAPVIGTAAPGVASASVPFTAPGNGGSAITGYTATSTPGSITGTGTVSPIVVSGLTNGTAYTFRVVATSALGNSTPSAASNSITPVAEAGVPDAPTIGTATAGDTTATANWTAPASDGGSAITGYEVKTYDAAGSLLDTDTVGVVLTFGQTGLTNGTAVKFKVAAINAIGTGAQSAFSNTVTPVGALASDNFNRANGQLVGSSAQVGGTWAGSTDFAIFSNQVGSTLGNDNFVCYLDAGQADHAISVVVAALATPFGCGLIGRATDADNFYFVTVDAAGGVVVGSKSGGVISGANILSNGSAGFVAGDTLTFICNGTSIDVRKNGVSVGSATSTIHATGNKVGIWCNTGYTAWRMDGFVAVIP